MVLKNFDDLIHLTSNLTKKKVAVAAAHNQINNKPNKTGNQDGKNRPQGSIHVAPLVEPFPRGYIRILSLTDSPQTLTLTSSILPLAGSTPWDHTRDSLLTNASPSAIPGTSPLPLIILISLLISSPPLHILLQKHIGSLCCVPMADSWRISLNRL